MTYDIYLVGVGGQGILTIGEILAGAAMLKEIPVNFFPSRGMAQRGGFVKAQLRLGNNKVGPSISEGGADMVIAMEQSEALKAIPFVKPGGNFILFGEIWQPTEVMLGKAPYPPVEIINKAVQQTQATLISINPEVLPQYEGQQVPSNIYLLGVAIRFTPLGSYFDLDDIKLAIEKQWLISSKVNQIALQSGFAHNLA